MPNKLKSEISPYLRQHQHNPVDWYPWGQEALDKARRENKLIIVSIGYSACHWCHVMERESFEDPEVAAVMNAHFISVKVDREERPDVDQIYMTAVQLMTNSGGWPLNCICLPDARPVYGGTYFRRDDWKNILLQLAGLWREEPDKAYDYAERLTAGIRQSEQLVPQPIQEQYTVSDLDQLVDPWVKRFDPDEGGYNRAPKFPLPNNWLFFLRYGALASRQDVLDHTHLTLRKMAAGGIYDHVGGGFARYSVDRFWHVPHFEKMLYDNAQLVSLYSEAYQQQKDPLYKRIVSETLDWVQREMTSPEGGFYSALDADSEGVEGKFYTFDETELEQVLGEDAPLFIRYFGITPGGNWPEEHTNVLKTNTDTEAWIAEAGFTADEWESYLREIKQQLLTYRSARVRPGLDDKILTSWNAMMVKGFADAYRVFGEPGYLETAIRGGTFILQQLCTADSGLLHQHRGEGRAIPGFLDDYAFCIQAFIALYEITFDERWVYKAKELAAYSVQHFYDHQQAAFYYVADNAEQLIARKYEIMDNVIPSSNSVMAHVLNALGLLFDEPGYLTISSRLLANVFPQMSAYGSAYSNWAVLLLETIYGNYEIALTGPGGDKLRNQLDQHYIPNKLLLGGTKSTLPLLENRITDRTQAYVCKNNTCSLPVEGIDELLALIQ